MYASEHLIKAHRDDLLRAAARRALATWYQPPS